MRASTPGSRSWQAESTRPQSDAQDSQHLTGVESSFASVTRDFIRRLQRGGVANGIFSFAWLTSCSVASTELDDIYGRLSLPYYYSLARLAADPLHPALMSRPCVTGCAQFG